MSTTVTLSRHVNADVTEAEREVETLLLANADSFLDDYLMPDEDCCRDVAIEVVEAVLRRFRPELV